MAIGRRWRAALLAASALPSLPSAARAEDDARARAEATEAQMTDDERVTLTLGQLTSTMPGRPAPPPEARPGAGYVPGVPRLGGAAVRGIQANNVISTLKHYAINPQETGRAFMNAVIAEDALRESDLLAFEIAIE